MIDPATLASLAGVALVAGFVDSVAGGGGLLCLPALLIAGLDPVAALATNKLQGTFGTASATYAFWKRKLLHPVEHRPAVIMVFIGAALGVLAVHYAPTRLLSGALPPLLILMALYFALSPRLSDAASHPRLAPAWFTFLFAPAIGFYDGVFGPGTGSFFMLSLVTLFGLSIVEATGRTKLFNFTSNVAALILFALGGQIVWIVGLAMGVGQLIGAQIGAHMAIRNGTKLIRPLLVIVSIAMAAKLLSDPNNPIRQLL